MGRWLAGALAIALLTIPRGAAADGRVLERLDAVHAACEASREAGPARLYVLTVDPGWGFGPHRERAGRLPVDTRRNLRALDGRVSLLITHFEPVAFDAEAAEVPHLRRAAEAGARLRIGFFLGFDEPRRAACVVRNRHAVTIVRADLAFAELVSAEGERLARAQSDRLRAWRDDRERLAIPGDGPRGAVGEARFSNGGAAPEGWQAALEGERVRAAIARCHDEGVGRGAAADAQVVVRLNVETRTGRVRRADVALSSVGDDEEARCIARALGSHAGLTPGPSSWQAEVVDLSVPVRLTAD